MVRLQKVKFESQSLDVFKSVVSRGELREAKAVAERLRERLEGRVFWNLNSTAVGGGVAEMLQSLLRYTRGIGIDTRWLVIAGNPEFFAVTKRLHHALHGSRGDGSSLGEEARRVYEQVMHDNAVELCASVRPGDLVLLHDPQTAGLAASMAHAGAHVVWRCHVGHDTPNSEADRGWRFLEPYLRDIQHFVFSRAAYIPEFCDHGKSVVVRPSIDAFSPKNRDLDEETIRSVLVHTGLVEGPLPGSPQFGFVRQDGSPGRVERSADVIRLGRAPSWETPLVVQVSRWDSLKDPSGVMSGFQRLCDGSAPADANLVLAGPNVSGVNDDPEGGAVFDQVITDWRDLPHAVRRRVHLVSIPTEDVEENAIIVNALQRHAAVVVQKSLREGFGLTVTEAMWKAKPVIASAVGGIQDQIEDRVNGLLLKDPSDLDAFAASLTEVLENPEWAAELGRAARERVREQFLGIRHLLQYAKLVEKLDL